MSPETTVEPRMDTDERGYRQELQEQKEKHLGCVRSQFCISWFDPFRKQSVSIRACPEPGRRVHPRFQLISPG